MLSAERRNRIANIIRQKNSATVQDLSDYFNVSTMTIRRDLVKLEQDGEVVRIHGGAMAPETPKGSREEVRATLYSDNKAAIGAAATQLVSDGQTIFIDAGTTTIELAKRLQNRRGLTIVTNYLRILTLLANSPGINPIGLGGSIYTGAWSFIGPIAEATLRRFHCDIAFLGIRSLSLAHGLTENNYFEATVKNLVINQSQKVVLLLDSSKFESVSPVTVAPLKDIDVIITDNNLAPDLIEAYRSSGVELILADDQYDTLDELFEIEQHNYMD